MKKKRIIAIALALALTLAFAPTALAAQTSTVSIWGLDFEITNLSSQATDEGGPVLYCSAPATVTLSSGRRPGFTIMGEVGSVPVPGSEYERETPVYLDDSFRSSGLTLDASRIQWTPVTDADGWFVAGTSITIMKSGIYHINAWDGIDFTVIVGGTAPAPTPAPAPTTPVPLPAPVPIPVPPVALVPIDLAVATEYVNSLYSGLLGRDPDEEGFDYWKAQLTDAKRTFIQVAYLILFSAEVENQGLTDAQFVTRLYEGLLGRAPDKAGLDNWVGLLGGGVSKAAIFNAFTASDEFVERCKEMGLPV